MPPAWKNPNWWTVAFAVLACVFSLVMTLGGGALRAFLRLEDHEARIVSINGVKTQMDEWSTRIQRQLEDMAVGTATRAAEFEGMKRELELLKKSLTPFATEQVLPFRAEDRDSLRDVVRGADETRKQLDRATAALGRQLEELGQVTTMHTTQVRAVRDMLEDILRGLDQGKRASSSPG